MHSSRMRPGRSLTVCWCLLPGEGGSGPRGGGVGIWSQGVVPGPGGSDPGGWCLVGGVCLIRGMGGVVSKHAEPSPVDRHTPVKTLPWPNFVAAGKDICSNNIVNCIFSMITVVSNYNEQTVNIANACCLHAPV